MNKGLILNGISPWFFVIICLLIKRPLQNGWGMGHAIPLNIEQTKEI